MHLAGDLHSGIAYLVWLCVGHQQSNMGQLHILLELDMVVRATDYFCIFKVSIPDVL